MICPFSLQRKIPPWQAMMMPAARELLMYVSIAFLSGADKEKSRPLRGDVPGCKLMAQSYGRWGGSDVALVLLKTI